MNDLDHIEMERVVSGDYEFRLNKEDLPGKVVFFVNDRPDTFENIEPNVVSKEARVFIKFRQDLVRRYFKIMPEKGSAIIVAERAIPFEGSVNFRDLGGYHTADGRFIKWGKLYRSGHLAHLTGKDKELFFSLDIEAVCDFRTGAERKAESADLPGDPTFFFSPIVPGIGNERYFHELFRTVDDPKEIANRMHDVLVDFVVNVASNYSVFFEALLNSQGKTFLMNCSAGKERTGVGAALLLSLLGVSKGAVLKDFMLSKKYFPYAKEINRIYAKYELDPDDPNSRLLVDPLLKTQASYLDGVFGYIQENFGTTTNFFKQELSFSDWDINFLKRAYTTDNTILVKPEI